MATSKFLSGEKKLVFDKNDQGYFTWRLQVYGNGHILATGGIYKEKQKMMTRCGEVLGIEDYIRDPLGITGLAVLRSEGQEKIMLEDLTRGN